MSKASQCIKMLALLQSGRTYKREELAALLHTNIRNVIEYRKTLASCGEDVRSAPGKDGGYYLGSKTRIVLPPLSAAEERALNEAAAKLKEEGLPSFSPKENEGLPPMLNPTESLVQDACAARRTVEIQSDGNRFILRALRVDLNHDAPCFFGYDEKAKQAYAFPLSSLQDAKILWDEERTELPESIFYAASPNDVALTFLTKKAHMGEAAIMAGGQRFEAKEVSDNAVLCVLHSPSLDEATSYALSMGSKIAVTEPKEVVSRLRAYAQRGQRLYQRQEEEAQR